jgi:D-serine deaminase-like pyridoxal phosphate-dependent protein
MDLPLESYQLADTSGILTPALLIYPDLVETNLRATLAMVKGDPGRWRPHLKTAKLETVAAQMVRLGIQTFKCATTLELATACHAGARDVLLALAVNGANARRVVELAREYPRTRISVLVEDAAQAAIWHGTPVGLFIDVNSGMNRTGIDGAHEAEVVALARAAGAAFRGLHWYDGHVSEPEAAEREKKAHAGYDRLLKIVRALRTAGADVEEVITSGTPAAPYGISYPGFQSGFQGAGFVHRVSPGTVVYNDMSSLRQLAGFGYEAAALVLATVISHPLPGQITCDAGHKSVSADAGVPTCTVVGHAGWNPLKPSEEHLPIEIPAGEKIPALGEKLYLLPRHVCPTVNNFDQALLVRGGRVVEVAPVSARGHENPLVLQGAAAPA